MFQKKKAYPKSKEIWWVNIGQNIGTEMNGKNDRFERPALVLKIFNRDMILICPISSKIKRNKYIIEFLNHQNEKNTVNTSQIRVLSSKRFIRKIIDIDDKTFKEVRNNIRNYI